MATVLGLAMQLTADASGMAAGLSEAEKQIKNLRASTDGLVSLFDKFAGSSDAAAAAQKNVAQDILLLTSAFKEGLVDGPEFAVALDEIAQAARAQAAAFAEGAATTAKYATEEERVAAAVAKLDEQLKAGAISVDTHARAMADVTGANAAAKRAEEEHAAAVKRAAEITKAAMTPQQIYDREIQELQQHLAAGRISQETYNAAVEKAARSFAKAEVAAAKFDAAAENAADAPTLKFNELSGIFSALPGPLGNVAGRMSGLASAGEGLSKIFSGGLTQGFAGLAGSVAGLINPFTVGLAAVAAFGAGAVALTRSLVALEDRVEKLGRLATQLGVSFDFVQTLEEAGIRTDVSIQQLQSSFARLQDTLAGGDANAKKAENALKNLGVSVAEFGELSEQQQIELIAERLDKIEDPALRSATAIDLFGKSGVQLLPFFREIDGAQRDIERLGAAISELDKQRLADLGAGFDALGVATRGLGQELTLPFVGLGEGIAQATAEIIGGVNAIIAPLGDVLEPFLTGFGRIIEFTGVLIGGIGRQLGALLAPIGNLFQALGGLFDPFNDGIVDAFRYLVDTSVAVNEFIASWSPIQSIADAINAVSDELQDFGSAFLEYVQPAIDIVERIGVIVQTVFANVTQWISDAIGEVVSILADGTQAFLEFTGLASVVEAATSAIASFFTNLWSTIKSVIEGIGGFILRVVEFAEDWLGIKTDIEDAPPEVEIELNVPTLAATQFAKEIGDAAKAAAEFGEAGFSAALQYQKALEDIAILVEEGELTQEEAKKAVEIRTQAFEQQIEVLERQAEAQKKAADEAEKAAKKEADAALKLAEADKKRIEAFTQSQGITDSKETVEAQEVLLSITRQVAEIEASIAEARASKDKKAEESLLKQLAILDQAQAAAQDQIDFGFTAADAATAIEKVRKEVEDALTDAVELGPIGADAAAQFRDSLQALEDDLSLQLIDPEQFEEAAKDARKIFDERVKTAQEVAKLEEKYAEKRAEIDEERLYKLREASTEPLKVDDLRTSAGASEFLRLVTGREDPAIEEYRKQFRELQKIEKEITKLGGVVDIVGAA